MFDRIFGRKSHEKTHSVRGVDIDSPIIESRNVPSHSFSSNGSSREGSPSPSDRHSWYRPSRREQVRRRPRPAPLQQESLTVNGANDWSLINADGSSDVSPVRRAGAVRHPSNPLTRRRQTFSGQDAQPDRQEDKDNRAASEPPRRAAGLGPDGTHVDLSTPFMPTQQFQPQPQPHPPPRSQVRLRSQNFPRDANHAQHRHPSAPITPASPSHVVYPGDLPPEEIRLLPSRLKAWINAGMTAYDIGRYAAQLLDGRDKFLGNLVSLLIDSETPYTNIGRAVLKALDVRDDTTNEPLHGKLPPGFKQLEPRRPLFTHDNTQPVHPQLVRPQRMPFFADDAHLDQFLHGEHSDSDGDTDAEIASPHSSPSPGIVQLKPGPERRVHFANSADIIPRGGVVPQSAEVEWAPESWSRGPGPEMGFRSFARQLTGSASGSGSGSRFSSSSRFAGGSSSSGLWGWEGIHGRGPFL